MVSGCKLNLKPRVKKLLTKKKPKTKTEAETVKDFSRKFHLLQLKFRTELPAPCQTLNLPTPPMSSCLSKVTSIQLPAFLPFSLSPQEGPIYSKWKTTTFYKKLKTL